MIGFNFEEFKLALKKRKEENYTRLLEEIQKLKKSIEDFLTKFFECTASQAQTRYSGLEMY